MAAGKPRRERKEKPRTPAGKAQAEEKAARRPGRSGSGALALAVLDGAVEGVVIAAREGGTIRYANASAGRMFGRNPGELAGENIRALHPAAALPEVLESFAALARGEIKLASSVPCLRRDGSVFWADVSSARLLLDGEACIVGFFTDVSGQKAARDASAEAQALFAGVFNAVPDILGIQDLHHGIIRYNEAGYRFLNLGPGAVRGKKCFELIGRSQPCERCATSETYRTKQPARLEKYIEPQGIWLDVRAYPIFDARGEMTGIVEHLRDITLQKRAEAELVRSEKLSSLAILAGGIAHDFNNLLGGIYGAIEMARAVSGTPDADGYLGQALETMGRARGLTQQLLTFAKGGAPALKPAQLGDFLRETVRFACSGASASFAVEVDEGLWACSYDANQLAQVVDNLLINARQAMPLGGEIRVTARNVTIGAGESPALAPGRYVRISVRDQGIGIPRESLDRIFDPFFTTKPDGSGLGLTTSFSIVRQHGGSIEVESEPGKGSTVHVFLPACEPQPESSAAASRAEPRTGRILIMDDEEMLRETISAMLQHHGYDTEMAADGAEALRLFDEGREHGAPFAAVILDLTIPGGMGGKETVHEIRKRDRDIPVFVASGYADDPILARPREFGFTDSIPKPFTRKALIGILVKHL